MVRMCHTWSLGLFVLACSVEAVEPNAHASGTSTGETPTHGTTSSSTGGATTLPASTGGTSHAEGDESVEDEGGTASVTGSTTATSESGNESSETTSASSVCDQMYGAAPDYVLCWETDTTCAFNAYTAGGDCDSMCSALGGTCVDAHDNPNDPGTECQVIQDDDDCFTNRTTEICECSK
jgi:hypothetical protein